MDDGEDVSESLRGAVLERAGEYYLAVDLESGAVVDANETVCQDLGYDRAELVGMGVAEMTTSSDAGTWRADVPEPGGTLESVEYALRGAADEIIPTEGSLSRVAMGDDEYVLALLHQLPPEAERRELERYRAFVEHSGDVITVVDESGTIEYVSPAARQVSGQEPDELIGTDGFEHVHPADRSGLEETMAELMANPGESVVHEYRFRTADGSYVWLETTASNHLEDDDVEGLVLVSRDISDAKSREDHLQELTGEYEALFENADDAIFLIDVDASVSPPEFRYERLNPYHESATGLTTEEVRGLTPVEALGEELGNEVGANYRRCVRHQEPISYEEALDLPGGEVVWQTSLAPVVVADEVVRIVGISRDVTERKEYEQRLERQRDDLQMLNQVLRHDIRNDLQVVQVYAEALQSECDDANREDVQRILESARHAVELTKTAREMAEVMLTPAEERHRVAVSPILDSELDRIRGSHPDALVTVDGAVPSATVYADEMLDSVFRNLMKNAVQHNDKAVPEVCVSATTETDRVVVRVGDNGPGISESQRDTIFGKGEKGLESSGAGIGLYLVQTLVESYGGEVRVEEPSPASPGGEDEGATFVVELPLVE